MISFSFSTFLFSSFFFLLPFLQDTGRSMHAPPFDEGAATHPSFT
jgi:hypothetical protein